MSNALKKITLRQLNDRRQRSRNAPSFPSRKGEKLVDGLTKAELVHKYEANVRAIAASICSKIGQTADAEDMVSVGLIGLMNAAEKFDPNKGAKFWTYAEIRVRGAILDELREQDWVPSSARRRVKRFTAASEGIERETGRKATDEELSEKVGISREKVQKIQITYGQLSLVHYGDLGQLEREESAALKESLQGAQYADPFTEASRKDTRAWLEGLFKDLPEESRTVLSCYYFRGLQVKEIATILEVSESRISQIHTRAILKLKQILTRRNQDLRSMFEMLLTA